MIVSTSFKKGKDSGGGTFADKTFFHQHFSIDLIAINFERCKFAATSTCETARLCLI